ncbi:hypothetical protein FB45DRAFT_886847, partial [Roridomyces roridus]
MGYYTNEHGHEKTRRTTGLMNTGAKCGARRQQSSTHRLSISLKDASRSSINVEGFRHFSSSRSATHYKNCARETLSLRIPRYIPSAVERFLVATEALDLLTGRRRFARSCVCQVLDGWESRGYGRVGVELEEVLMRGVRNLVESGVLAAKHPEDLRSSMVGGWGLLLSGD